MDTVVVASTANVSTQVSSIPMLNVTNFKVWKDAVEIVLGCMDLDIVLRHDKPIATEENANETKIEKWERFNRMSAMIMKRSVLEAFQDSITEDSNAKKFLKDVQQFFDS